MPPHEVEHKYIHYGVTFSQDWDQGSWGVGRDGGEGLCLGEASSGLDMSSEGVDGHPGGEGQ